LKILRRKRYMDDEFLELKERLINSIFKIKHLGFVFYYGMDKHMTEHGLNMTEVTLMNVIKNNVSDSVENNGISDIQKHLYITKAAVSKMLGVLEKKGYLNRKTNTHNRRTLSITLTPKGREILKLLDNDIENMLIEIIKRLGKPDIEQFILSINRFVDVTSGVIE